MRKQVDGLAGLPVYFSRGDPAGADAHPALGGLTNVRQGANIGARAQ